MTRYLVLAAQPWAQRITWPVPPGSIWTFATDPDGLESAMVYDDLTAAFSLHWHWMIPAHLLTHRCPFIGFHASNLPHFRGGAPIDNQQRRGITETQLTAFRLVPELDAGPILLQAPLSLAGTKADVLARIAALVPGMIARILAGDYTEREQPAGPRAYRRADAEIAWSLRLEDCPVCDLVRAHEPSWPEFGTCTRCGWLNVPDAREYPSQAIVAVSLHEARRRWQETNG